MNDAVEKHTGKSLEGERSETSSERQAESSWWRTVSATSKEMDFPPIAGVVTDRSMQGSGLMTF